jgi:hypothetical protein
MLMGSLQQWKLPYDASCDFVLAQMARPEMTKLKEWFDNEQMVRCLT